MYRDATVYLNGHKLGTHPYGYTSFHVQPYARTEFSGANVLAVRVDNSAQPNSRWYSGSGIYRHVRILVTDRTHMAHWGVFVTTPVATSALAKVSIHTRVANESSVPAGVTLETTLTGQNDTEFGSASRQLSACSRGGRRSSSGNRVVKSCCSGRLIRPAVPRGLDAFVRTAKPSTRLTTPFGIRSLVVVGRKGAAAEWQAREA